MKQGRNRRTAHSGESQVQRFVSENIASPYEPGLVVFKGGVFWQRLGTVEQQLAATEMREDYIAGTATVMTTEFSTGDVIWALRGRIMLASFMPSVPNWPSLDPLPALDRQKFVEEDSETLANIALSSGSPLACQHNEKPNTHVSLSPKLVHESTSGSGVEIFD